MELVPWGPFRGISTLRREMDDLWSRFLGEPLFSRTFTEEWLLTADISETNNNSFRYRGRGLWAQMPKTRGIAMTREQKTR